MAKKKRDKQHGAVGQAPPAGARQEEEAGPLPKMKRKPYELSLIHI